MEFDWDSNKADRNLEKHRVRFTEAATVWLDENALEIWDPDHSEFEDRWIRIGTSHFARVLIVVYVEKIEGKRIRIISARKATRTEIRQYEKVIYER